MPTRPIRITGSNSSTGLLELDDHGHTHAEAGDTILWQIGHDSGVASIVSIEKKSGANNFWSRLPHAQGNNWTGDISPTARIFAKYVYSITWLAKDGSGPHVHDPKISIRPSTTPISIITALLIVLAAALGLYTVKVLLDKKTNESLVV